MAFRLLHRRAIGILQSRSSAGAGATAANCGGLGRAGDLADRLGRRGLFMWPALASKWRLYGRGILIVMWGVSYLVFERSEELEDLRAGVAIYERTCEKAEQMVRDEEQFRKEIKQKMKSGFSATC